MKQVCKFCREVLAEGAKKCKTCGEPFYLIGKALKWTPLLSIAITLFSLSIAYREMRGREKATVRAEVAQSEARSAVSQLHVKERAADRALAEIARNLPESSREDMVKNLRLAPRTTLEQLELEAKKAPENQDLQRKLFLYRALNRPE
jgi:hypothetical protein